VIADKSPEVQRFGIQGKCCVVLWNPPKPGVPELLLTVDLSQECGPLILETFGGLLVYHLEEVKCCVVISSESQSTEVVEPWSDVARWRHLEWCGPTYVCHMSTWFIPFTGLMFQLELDTCHSSIRRSVIYILWHVVPLVHSAKKTLTVQKIGIR
jgi:hypothetical protein